MHALYFVKKKKKKKKKKKTEKKSRSAVSRSVVPPFRVPSFHGLLTTLIKLVVPIGRSANEYNKREGL